MSARGMLTVVGTAVGGLIGWSGPPPPADPDTLHGLLAELGLNGDDLPLSIRAFQSRTGLDEDGVAGPQTVHLLARYAREARELRLDLAA